MTPIELPDSYELSWGKVFFERTDLITDSWFMWFELYRQPTLSELRDLRRLWEQQTLPYIYVNVLAANEVNLRFARFFGLVPVSVVAGIAVLEKK